MAKIQLASGATVKDVCVWDGTRWVSRIVKVRMSNGWVDAHRPAYFSDNGNIVTKATRRTSSAQIDSNGLSFMTTLAYTVSQV